MMGNISGSSGDGNKVENCFGNRGRKFTSSDDVVCCNECGEWFKQVNWKHLYLAHDMSVKEYIDKYGLAKGELLSRGLRLIKSEKGAISHANNPARKDQFMKIRKTTPNQPKVYSHISSRVGKSIWVGTTPEERSAEISRRQKLYWSTAPEKRHKDVADRLRELRKGVPSWNSGKKLAPLSEEMKQKISQTLKGRPNTWGDKIGAALKGRKKSPEHVANMVKAFKVTGLKRRKVSNELVDKIRMEYKPYTYGYGYQALGKKYGISSKTVYDIVSRNQNERFK